MDKTFIKMQNHEWGSNFALMTSLKIFKMMCQNNNLQTIYKLYTVNDGTNESKLFKHRITPQLISP